MALALAQRRRTGQPNCPQSAALPPRRAGCGHDSPGQRPGRPHPTASQDRPEDRYSLARTAQARLLRVPERWPSGRRRPPAKRVYGQKPYRGFESHPLRHSCAHGSFASLDASAGARWPRGGRLQNCPPRRRFAAPSVRSSVIAQKESPGNWPMPISRHRATVLSPKIGRTLGNRGMGRANGPPRT